jgi:hypothetical protein
MHILLTYFHLHSRKLVLQDTSSETSGKYTKPNKKCKAKSIFQKCTRVKNGEAHLCNLPRQNTDVGGAQA